MKSLWEVSYAFELHVCFQNFPWPLTSHIIRCCEETVGSAVLHRYSLVEEFQRLTPARTEGFTPAGAVHYDSPTVSLGRCVCVRFSQAKISAVDHLTAEMSFTSVGKHVQRRVQCKSLHPPSLHPPKKKVLLLNTKGIPAHITSAQTSSWQGSDKSQTRNRIIKHKIWLKNRI